MTKEPITMTLEFNEREITTLRNALEFHQKTAVDSLLPWNHIANLRKRIIDKYYKIKDGMIKNA